QRAPVVRLAGGDVVDLGVLLMQLLRELHRAVPRAVLGEDDLVAPAERREPLAQIDDRRVQDRLLVVHGDHDRDAWNGRVYHRKGGLSQGRARGREARERGAECKAQCASLQFLPRPTSTTRGTASVCTDSILCRMCSDAISAS